MRIYYTYLRIKSRSIITQKKRYIDFMFNSVYLNRTKRNAAISEKRLLACSLFLLISVGIVEIIT